ncbi:enoyl-CoA hydratase/isomerase family protein [Desmospora profundinema]|uniref:Enoyl-CoA hydratase/carnithine racemase n=1 Tax=Desmospora profundinema TaxID=1571184 RepID=A0ABU1IJ68_9BACL|nr:enoyl-CoA hydratase/isomerase family protein [Desmospora profundinema]MDR6224822.1 enoyl-CoA hydratase/carnithine racemase [Desmospora profundinema]
MNTLRTSIENGVGWIRFHRPHVRNAVNGEMMDELDRQLMVWKDDEEVRVLVLAGDEKTFVSGGDLAELHALTTEEDVYPVMHRMGRVLEVLRNWGKPTLAAVEGTAVGGGCEIAASCDFRLASDRASFGFIQSKLGITSGWGGGSRLLEQVPRDRALLWLMTGERFDAGTAQRWGWVTEVLPVDGFERGVQQFAERLTRTSLPVLRAYLELSRLPPKTDRVDWEARSCARLWESDEHMQAVEQFLKRTGRL